MPNAIHTATNAMDGVTPEPAKVRPDGLVPICPYCGCTAYHDNAWQNECGTTIDGGVALRRFACGLGLAEEGPDHIRNACRSTLPYDEWDAERRLLVTKVAPPGTMHGVWIIVIAISAAALTSAALGLLYRYTFEQ